MPAPPRSGRFGCQTFAKSNAQKTIPVAARITKTHVKKLAMLYITAEAFSIINTFLLTKVNNTTLLKIFNIKGDLLFLVSPHNSLYIGVLIM